MSVGLKQELRKLRKEILSLYVAVSERKVPAKNSEKNLDEVYVHECRYCES